MEVFGHPLFPLHVVNAERAVERLRMAQLYVEEHDAHGEPNAPASNQSGRETEREGRVMLLGDVTGCAEQSSVARQHIAVEEEADADAHCQSDAPAVMG